MDTHSKQHCTHCGVQIPPSSQNSNLCSQCGRQFGSPQKGVNQPPKSGPMSHRQLILLMVLLPLLVVVMTVGSWYLIKAYRLPSVQVESQSDLMESEPVTAAKNSTLQPLNFIKK